MWTFEMNFTLINICCNKISIIDLTSLFLLFNTWPMNSMRQRVQDECGGEKGELSIIYFF